MFVLNLQVGWDGVGMMTFFELEHMVDATQLCLSCHCTHGGCYATVFVLNLHVGWGRVGMMTFFELEHMVDATQLCLSCHCTHGGCYATSKPPAESCKEILSSNLLKNCRMNSILYTDGCLGWKKAAKTSFRDKRFAVRSVIHKKSEWTKACKVDGQKKLAGTQVLDRTWMWMKKFIPHSIKNRGNSVLNPRLWDYVYQFVYRHNKDL